MEVYNVHQALKILQEYYITDSIQMVTRWIREGKIKAERSANRKEGWRIHHDDLFEFIEEHRPGLPEVMGVYEWYVENSFSMLASDHREKHNKLDSEKVKGDSTYPEELIKQLMEEKNQLENQLINMQDELNLVYEQITELTVKIQKLEEENAFLMGLYEQMDEMYQELIKKNQQESSNETPKTMERKLEKVMSTEDFKKIFKEVINKYEGGTVNFMQQENELINEIYTLFFNEDGELKNEVIYDEEEYRCPLTKKKYKNLRSMLKNAIRTKLEQTLNPVDGTVLANDSSR
ncbi:helix-turn-helix domain-containing protein [Parageobacillus thermoglucosidasius]|uniref:DNA-binding protein n=1 Tax=Parageobacillus thermoglucosidasius TaxID=1426 RepID=A0AB38QZX9_PARTM|nr:helix-turn-helix domain-containing protein [Parageobacillus thermoglucosidasius]UOE76908.1 DNA-binding protein [Parageobacillus thermoglucosidasius]